MSFWSLKNKCLNKVILKTIAIHIKHTKTQANHRKYVYKIGFSQNYVEIDTLKVGSDR